MLGVHQNTLGEYADAGRIPHIRTASGQRRYDVDAYLRGASVPAVVCYCLVSSGKQRDHLERQVEFMRERYSGAEIVRDVGGGLNWKRKGLVTLLERLHQGDKLRIVVAHRDRLARFGFEVIQWMAERNGGELVVLDNRDHSPNRNSPRIFSPSCTPSAAGSMDSAATGRLSRRIRVYPTAQQKQTLRLWFEAASWCFNETVARLREPGTRASWKAVRTAIIHSAPARLQAAPYQVKSIAVRDACQAVKNAKFHYKETGEFSQVEFRRRKDPRQGCFIPASAVSQTRHLPHHPWPPQNGREHPQRPPGQPVDTLTRAIPPSRPGGDAAA